MVFDTYRDRQNGFVFGTNPAGIEYDGQVSKEGGGGQTSSRQRTQTGSGSGFNLNWDASFIVRAHIGEMGWMAEFAIPLRTLRYGSGKPQSWGLNFQRNIRRKREQVYWSPVSRIFNLYRLSSAGDLHGLELATPRNFKVTPYALSSANRDFSTSTSSEFDAQFGIDAKFGVTPALNLDVTVNTDFAQVEVDDQQINLTRFNFQSVASSSRTPAPSRWAPETRSRTLDLPPHRYRPVASSFPMSGSDYNIGFKHCRRRHAREWTSAANRIKDDWNYVGRRRTRHRSSLSRYGDTHGDSRR